MKTIVLFKCPDSAAERHKLAGFNSAARELGWNVQTVDPVRTVATPVGRGLRPRR